MSWPPVGLFQSQFGFSGLCDPGADSCSPDGPLRFNPSSGFLASATALRSRREFAKQSVSIPVRVFWPLRPGKVIATTRCRRCFNPSSGFLASATIGSASVRDRLLLVSIPVRVFWPLRQSNPSSVACLSIKFQSQFGFSGLCDYLYLLLANETFGFQSQFGFSGLCDRLDDRRCAGVVGEFQSQFGFSGLCDSGESSAI